MKFSIFAIAASLVLSATALPTMGPGEDLETVEKRGLGRSNAVKGKNPLSSSYGSSSHANSGKSFLSKVESEASKDGGVLKKVKQGTPIFRKSHGTAQGSSGQIGYY